MQFHEVLDDRQPQSEAAEPSRDRLVGLLKPIEDVRQGIRLDADAGINDRDCGVCTRSTEGDPDGAACLA